MGYLHLPPENKKSPYLFGSSTLGIGFSIEQAGLAISMHKKKGIFLPE